MKALPGVETTGPLVTEGSPTHGEPARVLRWLWVIPKWFLGATLSLSLGGSLFIVGWTQRVMRRVVLYTWWRQSALAASDVSFASFTRQDSATKESTFWPNWVLGPKTQPTPEATTPRTRRIGRLGRSGRQRLVGSLTRNLVQGVQAALNSWVVTAPAGLLWTAGWYLGWQNSFNKGYENAVYGPVIFLLGMIWFSLAMFHVPLGLARQASTGDWRRFYDFRLIWTLNQRRWLASFGLGLAWAGAAAVAVILKTAPQYLAGYGSGLLDLPPKEALQMAHRGYWGLALGLFPLYVGIRMLAAQVYARSLIDAYQCGVLGEEALAENEWHACRRLGLLVPRLRSQRGKFVRLAAWLATRTGGLVAMLSVFGLWFALSFFNLVGEFLAKTEFGRGWINQPMIHLPWFDYTPRALWEAAQPLVKE